MFNDRRLTLSPQAFLTVYGLNGVIVDGCHIAQNPDADGESSETTIPIMNNSQIEIYRKRFVFEYPSKELRIKAMAVSFVHSVSLLLFTYYDCHRSRPQSNPSVRFDYL